MAKMLEGVKVVEVAMWVFGPSAGAVLSDWGADVIKIEPHTGDPVRGLNYAGIAPGAYDGFSLMYELYNRGKRSVAMDLAAEGSSELLMQLVDSADVFLVSLLPGARRKMGIDVEAIQARNPRIIYACASGQGAFGEDAEKGGYDSISFWARSGIASAVSPDDSPYPLQMPGGAFGDGLGGAIFAGGIAAALLHREKTGEGAVVDAALLATGMWGLQPGIAGAKLTGTAELPKMAREASPNPLVNTYRTSDHRYVQLCMLQGDRYWPGFCNAVGRPDLIDHPKFATQALRGANILESIAAIDEIFATRTLEEWKVILGGQEGQWDVVKKAGELHQDSSAIANNYVQDVDYGGGRKLTVVSSPIQFNREVCKAEPAPELGADSDAVLSELGLTEDQIIELKINGVVL